MKTIMMLNKHRFVLLNIIISFFFFSALEKQIETKDQQLANSEDKLQETNAENAVLGKKKVYLCLIAYCTVTYA